ncbi:hypothetical protein AKJ09_00310 [Labilithrix luteola]|uniref:Uncharacterized protein n=1 Tax=Labilithrix luteola TaxID=1391654 RepID=A0A0K1PJQ4_9BACT|nr:hypothetical protein AKJ09_00310 [Labilithrix luteola]
MFPPSVSPEWRTFDVDAPRELAVDDHGDNDFTWRVPIVIHLVEAQATSMVCGRSLRPRRSSRAPRRPMEFTPLPLDGTTSRQGRTDLDA